LKRSPAVREGASCLYFSLEEGGNPKAAAAMPQLLPGAG